MQIPQTRAHCSSRMRGRSLPSRPCFCADISCASLHMCRGVSSGTCAVSHAFLFACHRSGLASACRSHPLASALRVMGSARLEIRGRDELKKLIAAVDLWEDDEGFNLYFLSYPEAVMCYYGASHKPPANALSLFHTPSRTLTCHEPKRGHLRRGCPRLRSKGGDAVENALYGADAGDSLWRSRKGRCGTPTICASRPQHAGRRRGRLLGRMQHVLFSHLLACCPCTSRIIVWLARSCVIRKQPSTADPFPIRTWRCLAVVAA